MLSSLLNSGNSSYAAGPSTSNSTQNGHVGSSTTPQKRERSPSVDNEVIALDYIPVSPLL